MATAVPPSPRFPRKVLVLFAPADEAFARGYLAAALGLPLDAADDDHAAGLALSSRELSTRPVSELSRLVTTSRVVLPVLTPAFLADPWLQLSDELASHGAVDDDDATAGVVPILLAECEAPLHLRANVTLDFRRPDEWDDELARLRAYLEQPAAPAAALPCPYPGMRPFRADDAAYFHGRDAEIDDVLGRLAAGVRELYVLGPSGSGKSSLVAAGVVPRLTAQASEPSSPSATAARPLVVRTMRPGAAPVAALLAALAPPTPPPAPLDHVEDALAALFLAEPAAELLVVVDQTEELFSQADAAAQRQFAAALRVLRAEPRARLIFTARADFFAELLASDLWIEGSKQHFDLSPMRGEMLRQAIERPARKLHVHLEPALIDRLLADAADEPGALPLLQETLVHLWSRRRQRLLALDDYRAMGSGGQSGLAIALAARADQTLAALSRPQQVIARRVLLRMVTFGEGHPHTRRRQPRAALRGAEAAADFDAALRALADSRLIILDRDEAAPASAGEAAVRAELCHDMLITAWPSFARWVEARRADEQRRRQLQDHAADWVARGRGSSGLLDETELAVALAWRHSEAARELGESAELTAMIAASHRALDEQKRRHRRRVRTAIAGLALFTAVSLLLTLWAMRERGEAERQGRQAMRNEQIAVEQRQRSESMLTAQYQDSARRLILEKSPQRAISYLVAARERAAALPLAPWLERAETAQQKNLRFLFHAATANFPRFVFSHPGRLTYAELSEEAQLVATGGEDGDVRLWSSRTGLPTAAPLHHPAKIRRILFSPAGDRMAVLCFDGSLHLWDLPGGAPVARAFPQRGQVRIAIWSGDGRMLITGDERGGVQRWDVASASPIGTPLEHDKPIFSLELSPDQYHLAVIPIQSKAVTLWTLSPRPTSEVIGQEMVDVASAAFSADSARLAIAYYGIAMITMHELSAPGRPARSTLIQYQEPILQSFFLPGRTLLVADHHVVLDASAPSRAVAFDDRILNAMITRDRAAVVVWCADSTLRVLDTLTGEQLAQLEVPFNTERTVMSSDGQLILNAPDRDQVTMWQLAPLRRTRLALEANTLGAAFSPDGARLATTAFAGVQLWDPRTGKQLGTFAPPRRSMARHLRFSADGRTLAMLGWDREVNLCSVEELRCRTVAPGWWEPESLPPDAAVPFDFSPDGKLLAAAVSADAVQLWDARETGRRGLPMVHSHGEANPQRHGISAVSFSRDGARLLVAGDDGSATLWDVASRKLLGRVSHPAGKPLSSAAWRGDGLRLATTAFDGSGFLWDARTLEAIAPLDHEGELLAAVFSPDDQQLATYGKDGALRLWDATTGAPLRVLRFNDWVLRFFFTPDSARFFTVSGGKVQIWDASTGDQLLPAMEHPLVVPEKPHWSKPSASLEQARIEGDQWIRGAVLSPDGATLLTIGMRSEARLWDVGLDERTPLEWKMLQARSPFAPPATPARP